MQFPPAQGFVGLTSKIHSTWILSSFREAFQRKGRMLHLVLVRTADNPFSLTLETYVLSYLLVWDTTWVSIVGALMWGDVCQCSSPMEQMAVSLELSFSKMNAGTVPIYQRLFLTPMDAKQVCPVIFLRQIPPVQRDPETVLCWNRQKLNGQSCYTARGSKRRGQILYTVHGNHKAWTFRFHITSLIIVVLGGRNLWYPLQS